MSDQFGVTPTQATYLGAQFAPGMGFLDASGGNPGFPPADAEMVDIFSAPNEPSMAENIKSGGLDRYLIAPLQGLGVVGDAAYGIPLAGPLIGAGLKVPSALAAIAGGVGKAKKGITALDDTKKSIKPLSEKEFYKKYDMHHDLKGASTNYPKSDSDTLKNKILDEGIKAGWVNNAYPGLKGKPDYYDNKFGTRKGQTTYLVPKANVDESGTKIIKPYKISQEEVLDFDYDFQPAYEAYLKNIDKLNKVNKNKGITALDDTKKMLKADVDAFARDDTGFVSPTLKALIERAPANLKGKQITDWLNANANKGVKPKELEYLGFEEFLIANPNATVREAVQGVSGNKVKVTRTSADDTGDSGPLLEFDVQDSLADPLDGSKPYWPEIRNILNDPGDYDVELLDAFNEMYPRNAQSNWMDASEQISLGFGDLDEVAESAAKTNYMNNPYQMIQPMTRNGPNNYDNLPAFAYGNDEVGYQLFVNGVRKTNPDNVPYSQTEAQIQLRNAMQDELGTDPFRIQGEDDFYFDNEMAPRNYQEFVDASLPGGENYRQVLFRWENAPKGHNALDHFDDDQAIAHALVRDRKLADGTDSLHVDELQSDVHTKGAKNGYRLSDAEFNKIKQEIDPILEGTPFTLLRHAADDQPGLAFAREGDLDGFVDLQRFDTLASKGNVEDSFKYDGGRSQKVLSELGEEKFDKFVEKVRPLIGEGTTPNFPFKDDWHNMSLQQLVLDAIENGKDTISVSGSVPMIARYSDRYATFYETLYDKKIPSAMKKLANKYGGKFETGKLDEVDTPVRNVQSESFAPNSIEEAEKIQDSLLNANILRITPEMKAKVLEEGFPGFALGGEVSTKGIKALGLKGIVMPKEVDLGIGSIR